MAFLSLRNAFWGGVARYIARRPALVDRLIRRAKKTPYTHIADDYGDVYMYRYWMFNAYPEDELLRTKRSWIRGLLPSVRLHRIVRKDQDRHLHNHPWNARTLILAGGYTEVRKERDDEYMEFMRPMGSLLRTRLGTMNAGQTSLIRHDDFHRIDRVHAGGCWTLFITWGYSQGWGFDVDGVTVPWREYLASRRAAHQREALRYDRESRN